MNLAESPEDFWSRRANAPAHTLIFPALDAEVEVAANHPAVLEAARLSARRFSQAAPGGPACRMSVHVIVRPGPSEPPPAGWPERLEYTGVGDWISVSAGAWGYGVGDLGTGRALVVVAPPLAEDARLVSRYLIDHYVLNFLFANWAMLHASAALHPEERVLVLLIGAHNAGKSTTALRLMRAGWRFLADGMALLQVGGGRVTVGGYPVGEVKLRDDVLADFPEYADAGQSVQVREQRKTVVDLRAAHPERVLETVVAPDVVHLCFAERESGAQTALESIEPGEARRLIAANTVYWDTPPRLERNRAILDQLLVSARCHRLRLGADLLQLVSTLEKLR